MKLEAIIAQRLSEARKTAGLTQQELGVAAGIEEETAKVRIHQYEQAKHLPPYSMLERLAEVLGKPITWFVCRDGQQDLILALDELSSEKTEAAEVLIRQLMNDRTT